MEGVTTKIKYIIMSTTNAEKLKDLLKSRKELRKDFNEADYQADDALHHLYDIQSRLDHVCKEIKELQAQARKEKKK